MQKIFRKNEQKAVVAICPDHGAPAFVSVQSPLGVYKLWRS
jgi:hypothetical protein